MRAGTRERTLWWRGFEVHLYRPSARLLHWLTAILVLILIPSGLWMTSRAEANLWDDTTNTLYSLHKVVGFAIIWIVLVRIAVRLLFGAPPEPVQLGSLQRTVARVTHSAIYMLLLLVPLAGWAGISMFPAVTVFNTFDLPAIFGPDKDMAEVLFTYHAILGKVLIALIAVHILAALLHGIVLRDGVFQRMWPPRNRSRY